MTRADVEAAASGPKTSVAERKDDELVAVRGIRARIADRMALSRARIPDATCSVEVDCSKLLALRAALVNEIDNLTPFILFCRLLVNTLLRHQRLNASFVESDKDPQIRLHRSVHLGVATATGRGLLVPVVRDADRLSTVELAARISELAEGARAGNLAPTELQGSTFTVSNFGALGLDDGIPVINYPEAAILGLGAVKQRPVVVDGSIVVRPTMRTTLAFDHRVCDGAEAGAFLSELRRLYEAPELALLHL